MKKLFFAFPILLLASCQSERVAFRFQPVAPTAAYVPRHHAPAASQPAQPDSAAVLAAPAAPIATSAAVARPAHRWQRATSRQQPLLSPDAVLASATLTPASRPLQGLMLKRLVRQHATAGPARIAESGLGGIGLFVIAVVLGILAGLGALVSLIPGISFFGGVGLAAAGLLVIFLLYSLLSGGKKKKTPAK